MEYYTKHDWLFDNVGQDIKYEAERIAIRLMIPWLLGAVLSVIAGFWLGDENDEGIFALVGIVAGVLLAITGVTQAKLKVMVLYGFGVIVERLDHLKGEYFTGTLAKNKKAFKDIQSADGLVITRNPDGTWICPFCDHKNPVNIRNCQNPECGFCRE